MKDSFDFYIYHKTRSVLDFKYIGVVFEREERELLKVTQDKYPNHIIRMPNHDLVASGFISGIGGSVPADCNGEYLIL